MALCRGVTTRPRFFEFICGNAARRVGSEFTDAAEDQSARAAFFVAVLNEIWSDAAWLYSNTESLQRAVASIPLEHVAFRIGT